MKIILTLSLICCILSTSITFANVAIFKDNIKSYISFSDTYNASYTHIFEKMKSDMNSAPNTGNVDLDFVKEMIPHHIGGIDMAKSILKYGTNKDVQKIANHIVISQEKQIPLMKCLEEKFEKAPKSDSEDSNDYINAYDEIKNTMFTEMESVTFTNNPDYDFLRQMIYHHEGAINMAKNILKFTEDEDLIRLCENIISTQNQGIDEMKNILKEMKLTKPSNN